MEMDDGYVIIAEERIKAYKPEKQQECYMHIISLVGINLRVKDMIRIMG